MKREDNEIKHYNNNKINNITINYDDDESPHEECGILGVFSTNEKLHAARLAFFGLYALQHRGQESAGICSTNRQQFFIHKNVGLVSHITEEQISLLKGSIAVGHVRYSTAGSSDLKNAQPFSIETRHGPIAVAHNGTLTKAKSLKEKLFDRGVGLFTDSDSEIIVQMLANRPAVEEKGKPNWEARIKAFMMECDGAYSLVVQTRTEIYAVRDKYGLRPLCIGEINSTDNKGKTYIVASESCALLTIGANFIREVLPGEILRVDSSGLTSSVSLGHNVKAFCVFEYVYFARPDSTFEGQLVHQVRQKLGRQLGREHPCKGADMVIGIPDSSIPAAIGYSQETGIPFMEGLTKNRYIGRTFIQPDTQLRQKGVQLKFNALAANLKGKKVVLIDDSIVRGNTILNIIKLVYSGGAKEVHVRICSPPVTNPCYMGIDMSTYEELIAHTKNEDEICKYVGADSLKYLSIEGMMRCVEEESTSKGHCNACFSGKYDIEIEDISSVTNKNCK